MEEMQVNRKKEVIVNGEHPVELLAEHGVGYGSGKISTELQLQNGELTHEALRIAFECIKHHPEVVAQIESDITDDGCGDGRPAIDTYVVDEDGQEIHFSSSHNRAKVFGGGLVVSASMWRAVNGIPTVDDGVLADREYMATQLKSKAIEYGGHCDDHAHGESCGCGAIDRYEDITRNITQYRTEITKTLKVLYGDDYADNHYAVEQVFDGYEHVNAASHYFAHADGKKTLSLIEDEHAVVKKLEGAHQEDIIFLNDVEDETFSQPAFTELMQRAGADVPVQVFAVDVWRGRMYADVVAQIFAQEKGGDYEAARQVAYADFLIRTLAVAATLTAGDLPVFARYRAGKNDFSLAF